MSETKEIFRALHPGGDYMALMVQDDFYWIRDSTSSFGLHYPRRGVKKSVV